MTKWHNKSGRPLSSLDWLLAHHCAKLPERKRFAQRISKNKPSTVVDVGCGPGLWLDLLNDIVSENCRFIGLDSDAEAIKTARERARQWSRDFELYVCDFSQPENIPQGDLYLVFNVFSYMESPEKFLSVLAQKLEPDGVVAVRQYDGGAIRFGPMPSKQRFMIDTSLHASVIGSRQFHHYDMDRVYRLLATSRFTNKQIQFETFQRIAPFPDNFMPYYRNMLNWTMQYVSAEAAKNLQHWFERHLEDNSIDPSYFIEIDLTALLS